MARRSPCPGPNQTCSRSVPFYDQKKVVGLLDELPAMTDAGRVGWDPVLMSILSACVLQERSKLSVGRASGN